MVVSGASTQPLGFGDTASDWEGHGIDEMTGKSKKVSSSHLEQGRQGSEVCVRLGLVGVSAVAVSAEIL